MNKTLVLAAVLLALIGLYVVLNQNEPTAKLDIPLVEADSADVTAMRVVTVSDTVELRKEGDGWKIMGAKAFPANPQNVGRAVQRFGQMTRKAIVTDKPDRYGEFEVDGVKGVQVTLTANGQERTIFLGKAGPTMQTSYARVEGSKEVWEVGGNHASNFRRPAADWRDKTISALAMDSVRVVTVRHDGRELVLTKQDSVWSSTENGVAFPGMKQHIERITRMLSRINAVEFADTLGAAFFDAPKATVLVEMLDGARMELKFVPRDDKQYYVRKTGALTDYVLYNSTVEVLLRKKEDLVDKPKPAGQ